MSELSQSDIIDRYRQLIRSFTQMTSILDTDVLLMQIIDFSIKIVDAEAAWLLLPGRLSRELNLKTGQYNGSSEYLDISVPIDASIEGWAYFNQMTVVINDISQYNLDYGSVMSMPGKSIESLIILPVSTRNKWIGVLEVVNRKHGEFTQLDKELLEAFVQQAAINIDNSQRVLQADLVPELVHELRTPLAALNTALHLLQRPDLEDQKRGQISSIIQAEFNRLSELTTSFLDYARLESGKEKFNHIRFDLKKLILDTISIIQMPVEDKALVISLNLPPDPLYLTADKDKIKQVIINLLSNAIKYNHPGGYINIAAGTDAANIVFSIQDNGPGIAPEYIPFLFDRFFRIPSSERQIMGTGLGLTISKHIIDGHNGRLEVFSTLGEGSTFTVRLPVNGGNEPVSIT